MSCHSISAIDRLLQQLQQLMILCETRSEDEPEEKTFFFAKITYAT